MLDDTLIIWGGEFGRTPDGPGDGRDHHILGFSLWMAGGGIKGGLTYGATDELGYRAVEDVVHVRDLHATLLHLCGIDHRRLSLKYQGLDIRLTGVEPARVVNELLVSILKTGLLHLVPGQGKKHTHDPNGCHPSRASGGVASSASLPAPGSAGSLDRDAVHERTREVTDRPGLPGGPDRSETKRRRRPDRPGPLDASCSRNARVLVLDPERQEGVAALARELGATHVISGFVTPPEVAVLIDRWITLAEGKTALPAGRVRCWPPRPPTPRNGFRSPTAMGANMLQVDL